MVKKLIFKITATKNALNIEIDPKGTLGEKSKESASHHIREARQAKRQRNFFLGKLSFFSIFYQISDKIWKKSKFSKIQILSFLRFFSKFFQVSQYPNSESEAQILI